MERKHEPEQSDAGGYEQHRCQSIEEAMEYGVFYNHLTIKDGPYIGSVTGEVYK